MLFRSTASIVSEPARDDIIAAIESRARVYASELQKADADVASMSVRYERVKTMLSDLKARRETLRNAKKGVAASLKTARAARASVSAEARKAARVRKGVEKQVPMDEVISNIVSNIQNRTALPQAILDRVAPDTGRVKARTLPLTPEQRMIGMNAGFIRSDLAGVLSAQHDQLAGWFGLHEGLDIRPGGAFESWSEVVRKVQTEYDAMATKETNPKARSKIAAEGRRAIKDLNVLKERLLGITDVGMDRDSLLYWGAQKVLQTNLMRYGAGFLPASFGDLATASVISRGMHKHLFSNLREVADLMSELYRSDPSGFRAMVAATEIGQHGTRWLEQFDAANAVNMNGVGARGSPTHTITSRIDRVMNATTDKVHMISGMRSWNRFNKIATAVIRKYALKDMVAKYGALSSRERAGLASIGIGEAEAKAIHAHIQKFAPDKGQKFWDPNLDAWEATPEGRSAARSFRIAIQRDMNRAIPTPGIGDKPILMDKMMGKIWLQFMSYSFSMMNRFLTPSSQKIATWRDASAIMGFAHLLWLGGATVIAKDLIGGRDPAERFKGENVFGTLSEIVDRSGLYGYLSPFIDSAIKVSAPLQEATFGKTVVGPTSRYARSAWAESLLGASFGLFKDIQQFGAAVSEGTSDQVVKKGLNLVPANTLFRLMHHLATDQ